MTRIVWANNANSTLAGPITNASTTALLVSGTGALFPTLAAGQYFDLTFNDAATRLLYEVVHVTAISGDTITIVRGQEGTTALSWLAGDLASNLVTMGALQAFAQAPDTQAQTGNYAADTSGSANTITATLSPAPASLASIAGSPIRIAVANTTTSTTVNLNLNGLGNVLVKNPGRASPPIGSLSGTGIYTFTYDGTYFQTPAVGAAASGLWTETSIAVNTSLNSGSTNINYVATAALTLTIAQSTSLATTWTNNIFAQGGAVTVVINGSDKLNNGSVGVGTTIPKGYSGSFTTDVSGNVYLTVTEAGNGIVTIASASTVDLGSAGTNTVKISGTTTITSFGSSAVQGQVFFVTFAGALTLTNNNTSLLLPGGANITTAANDSAVVEALGSGNFQVTTYSPKSGKPVASSSFLQATNNLNDVQNAATALSNLGGIASSSFNHSQAGSGYQYCNGTLIQWAWVPYQSSSADYVGQTFPISFPTTVACITGSPLCSSTATDAGSFSVNAFFSVTTSGFGFHTANQNSNTAGYYILAIGF